MYTISARFRSGYEVLGNGTRRKWNYVGDCGEFRSTIDFEVSGPSHVNGILIQLVDKRIIVDVYDEDGAGQFKRLCTTEAISAFTRDNVLFSNDKYFEYFDVRNGQVFDPCDSSPCGDQFGNGAIVKYDETGPIVDDEKDMGKGLLQQTGLLFFVEMDNADLLRAEYDWRVGMVYSPANGLPYIPFNKYTWRRLTSLASSPIYQHIVEYEWSYLSICSIERKVVFSDRWTLKQGLI